MAWQGETVGQVTQTAAHRHAYFIVFILIPNKNIAALLSDVQRECFAGNSIRALPLLEDHPSPLMIWVHASVFHFRRPARFQKQKQRQHNGEQFAKEVQSLVQNLNCLWANSQASVDEFTCCVIVVELVVVLWKEMIYFPGQVCLPVWRVLLYLVQLIWERVSVHGFMSAQINFVYVVSNKISTS